MTRLYFARHAQSQANVEQWISGWTDVQLTDFGREQAKELGNKLCSVSFSKILQAI